MDKASDWVKAAFTSRNSQIYWTPPHAHLQVSARRDKCELPSFSGGFPITQSIVLILSLYPTTTAFQIGPFN